LGLAALGEDSMQALLNRSTKNASTERVDKTMFRTFYGYVSSVADTKKHPDGSPASPAELRNVGAFLEGATKVNPTHQQLVAHLYRATRTMPEVTAMVMAFFAQSECACWHKMVHIATCLSPLASPHLRLLPADVRNQRGANKGKKFNASSFTHRFARMASVVKSHHNSLQLKLRAAQRETWSVNYLKKGDVIWGHLFSVVDGACKAAFQNGEVRAHACMAATVSMRLAPIYHTLSYLPAFLCAADECQAHQRWHP
jgi:hypothetical protein